MQLEQEPFAKTPEGIQVHKFTFSNDAGLKAEVMSYGGTLISLHVPDRHGKTANVNLGFDTLEEYLTDSPYFGALVGRYANRITAGRFTLDGHEYTLACNDTFGAGADAVSNHLHGGNRGYDKVVWKARPFKDRDCAGVALSYVSPDREEGYPGTLRITVAYSLSEDNKLSFEFTAKTDRATPVNLTQHSYWNLAGAGSGSIDDHQLQLFCPFFVPVGKTLMPTGEILSVQGTPMDFTQPKAIGRDIASVPGGYDHCFAAGAAPEELKRIADVHDPSSGRAMEVWTTKPGVQFYSGNFLDGIRGAGGARYDKRGAFCLEAEFFPDSVNQPHFPSCILRPGQEYRHRTVHRFYVA